MFKINLIEKPGFQDSDSQTSSFWSYLHLREEKGGVEIPSKENYFRNNWKYYFLISSIFLMIGILEFWHLQYKNIKPDNVLNQVIDLIIESGYLKNIKLMEANFSKEDVNVTIRSNDLATIHNLTQGYRLEDEIPFEIYKKGEYSYVTLIFPWEIKYNDVGTESIILDSMAKNTVFSNKININNEKEQFRITGRSSDIISYLLKMADNEQIQKFNFSVFHNDSGEFDLIVKLNLI
tara:strand:- start:305 stop:1009 length:705 start_codon:yes stop_codon:yes gene_type:complete